MGFNKGQLYEQSLFKLLKQNGKVPSDIVKVEQILGQDVTVENQFGRSGIEIKLNGNAAFGSGTLKFDNSKKDFPWKLTESNQLDDDNTSKEIMRSIARKYRLDEVVNKKWYKDNQNYYPLYLEEEKYNPLPNILKIPKSKRGKRDAEALSDIRIKCKSSDIIDYYTSKGSHYIQVGDKGLYWFGKEDPLNIASNLDTFAPTETYLRVRVQPKGGEKYNFSYGLYIKGLSSTSQDLMRNPNII
jgi:hypothetical protein